jgi:hypothetical protein
MKAPKPPTPQPDPQPQPASVVKGIPDEINPHLKGAFRRHILRNWRPETAAGAHDVLEQSLARAECLSSVLAACTFENTLESASDLSSVFELLSDLLYLSYGMIEWWDTDEAELIKAGWTPPSAEESHR